MYKILVEVVRQGRCRSELQRRGRVWIRRDMLVIAFYLEGTWTAGQTWRHRVPRRSTEASRAALGYHRAARIKGFKTVSTEVYRVRRAPLEACRSRLERGALNWISAEARRTLRGFASLIGV